jgi:hypothetical protein
LTQLELNGELCAFLILHFFDFFVDHVICPFARLILYHL